MQCLCFCLLLVGGGLKLYGVQTVGSFISPEPHPETIDLAKRLIDELQTREKTSAASSRLPRVPCFQETEESLNRKPSALELLGSSDSECVSECDFSALHGGSSDGECSDAFSCEDMYSEHEHHSDSGESSGSNYESSSSFEARKAKQHTKSSHGSATSKAAAKGRKDRMIANRTAAFQNSPQSIYLKNKKQTPNPRIHLLLPRNVKQYVLLSQALVAPVSRVLLVTIVAVIHLNQTQQYPGRERARVRHRPHQRNNPQYPGNLNKQQRTPHQIIMQMQGNVPRRERV